MDPYAYFESAVLPNGLTVHVHYQEGRAFEAMGFLVHSGARHDPIDREGLAHFVEHLVSENGSIPYQDMQTFFQDCGGEVSFGSTGYSDTRYEFFVPKDTLILSKALSIFGSMLISAKLVKDIEHEREVILDEFDQWYPLQHNLDLELHRKEMLYSDSWFGRFVRPLGTKDSIMKIEEEDLQSFYDTHYTPANISIVGVGGVRLSELVKLLSQSPFGQDKVGERTLLPIPLTGVDFPLENCHIFKTSEYFTSVVNFGGYQSFVRIPGNVNDQVMRILNCMINKTLYREVREKRAWKYAIGSSWEKLQDFYELQIACNTLSLNVLDEIEEVIEECIDSIGHQECLFEEVKRHLIMSNFLSDLNGSELRHGALNDLVHYRRIVSLQETNENIARVTMDDISRVLRWIRSERRWTLLIRP